jgi:hypothetical protein
MRREIRQNMRSKNHVKGKEKRCRASANSMLEGGKQCGERETNLTTSKEKVEIRPKKNDVGVVL